MSINRVILLGNVGQEPTIRTTKDGKKIASFSLATSEKWKNKSGKVEEKVQWHKVVIYSEGLASVIEKYVSKGSQLYIEGQLQTRKWDDKGTEKYITEVILQGFGCKLEIVDNRNNHSENVEPQVGSEPSEIEDEIPFF